jgi:hypothetical protein
MGTIALSALVRGTETKTLTLARRSLLVSGAGFGASLLARSSWAALPEYKTARRTVRVSTYAQLAAAISQATAGTHIVLADGTYSGDAITVDRPATQADPIVLRAANRLGAVVRFNLTLQGTDVWLYGLDCARPTSDLSSGTSVAMASGSQRHVVRRCRVFRRVGTLIRPWGSGHVVDYCDLSVWGKQEVPKNGSGGNFARGTAFRGVHDEGGVSSNVTVRRNHFHDCPFKTTVDGSAPYGHYPVTGVSTGINPREFDKKGYWLIQDNLFDKTGLFDITVKTSYNSIIGNTIVGAGNRTFFNMRSGNYSKLLRNYTRDGNYGYSSIVHGGFHEIGGNDVHQAVALKWGNFDWDQVPSGDWRLHRAHEVRVFRDKGQIRDGQRYSSEQNVSNLPPRLTRVTPSAGQTIVDGGGINRDNNFPLPYDPGAAVRLTAAEVGPAAPWVAP